ncbi:transcriptional antiterminator, BglG family [Ignavigranum ruoffiae]|uniref:Transcriptional antiterminator, BglG family n=1 Tax=Ignavigranum ruoffiae TaxID=89093 RepID=A0A1H9B798_9LACT|nr:PRD domain-containing protein [Ignavigranum ruoffiae]SEP84607.1 transcriptional antiterminator, BglG family [Ignavigranum ruoffiae]
MELSFKEFSVINQLDYSNFIPVSNISKKLGVSNKTIYRLIKKINELSLRLYNNQLILSEPGKGYVLNSFFIDKKILPVYTQNNEDTNILQNKIKLLTFYPNNMKIDEIFPSEFLSESTLNRMVQEFESELSKFDIRLKIKNKNIYLNGQENDIRKLLRKYILMLNRNSIMNGYNPNDNVFDEKFIFNQINIIEDKMKLTITYPYDVNIITHLFMIIERYRSGYVDLLTFQEPLDNEEKKLIKNNQAVYNLSKFIVKNIESYLNLKISSLESYFLFQNIISVGANNSIVKKITLHTDIERKADYICKSLIFSMYRLKNSNELAYYNNLYVDLYNHIIPMLTRLEMGIDIDNSLLLEIKKNYKSSFKALKDIFEVLKEKIPLLLHITDNEIGYITIYFEKYKIKYNEQTRVILVCSTGIGTSELLKINIEKNIPEIEIVDTVSARVLRKNLNKYKDNFDLILTTINVELKNIDKPILMISPILNNKDIETLKYYLKEDFNENT